MESFGPYNLLAFLGLDEGGTASTGTKAGAAGAIVPRPKRGGGFSAISDMFFSASIGRNGTNPIWLRAGPVTAAG